MQLCPLPYTTHLHQHPLLRHQALPLALCCRRSLEHGQDGVGVAQQAQHAAQQRAQRLAAAIGGVLRAEGIGTELKIQAVALGLGHCGGHMSKGAQPAGETDQKHPGGAEGRQLRPSSPAQQLFHTHCGGHWQTDPVALQDVHHRGVDAVKVGQHIRHCCAVHVVNGIMPLQVKERQAGGELEGRRVQSEDAGMCRLCEIDPNLHRGHSAAKGRRTLPGAGRLAHTAQCRRAGTHCSVHAHRLWLHVEAAAAKAVVPLAVPRHAPRGGVQHAQLHASLSE